MQGSSFTSPISAVDQSIHSPQATHSSPHIRLSQENWKEMKPISFGVEIVEAVKPRGGRDDQRRGWLSLDPTEHHHCRLGKRAGICSFRLHFISERH